MEDILAGPTKKMNDDTLREFILQLKINAIILGAFSLVPPLMHWIVTDSPTHSYMLQLPSVLAYAFIVWLYSPKRWLSVNIDAFAHSGHVIGALALVPLIYVMFRAIAIAATSDNFHTRSNNICVVIINLSSVMGGIWFCWLMRALSTKEPHWARRWPPVFAKFKNDKKVQ